MSARRAAVVVNPTKFDDLDDVRRRITEVCRDAGWDEPLWLETTEEDPGVGQAQEAVDAGVTMVCPLGGDGTVRAVATSLVGTSVPMGLLPGGTGNLLARNLELPVDSIEEALAVALSGRDRRIDVGLVRLSPQPVSPEALLGDASTEADPEDPRRDDEEIFLVMTGIGVDAEVMAGTDEKVKGVIGWPAYVMAGTSKLAGRGFRARVGPPDRPARAQNARTVIVGNCGTLQGDFLLMPEAELDDGILDTVVMSPQGVFGWASLGLSLATRRRKGHPRLTRITGKRMNVSTDRAVEAQIDGDPMGEQHGMQTRVLPGALVVRVP